MIQFKIPKTQLLTFLSIVHIGKHKIKFLNQHRNLQIL